MLGFEECRSAQDAAYNYDGEQHEAHFSHELIAGAASFEAMRAFEKHQRSAGEPVQHEIAKELLMAFAAAEVDKLAETKGLDFLDREEAKHRTKKQAEHLYDQHYGPYDDYNPQEQEAHETMRM